MLEEIKDNIARLIALYEGEKQRADSLAERLQECETVAKDYRTQITELNGQIDNMKLVNAFMGTGNPGEAKARIDKLVREIDKCIKLLEK